MATDFLASKQAEINARLDELKPLVVEYERLRAATAALDAVNSAPLASTNGQHSVQARATARQTSPATAARRGRPRGSGARGAQALELVKSHPGITIPEMAEKMGIKQNYLYRVLPGLAHDNLVIKDGRGWKPTTPRNRHVGVSPQRA
jgi:hypothetical protein